MPKVTLSAHVVNTATCPDGKNKENYYDTAITGFILEVRSTGGKTYALRYTDEHGRQRQHKIGDSKSISFDAARKAAQVLRSKVVLGENPSEERKVKRTIPTLQEFFDERYTPYMKGYKRSWKTGDAYFRNHTLRRFGSLHLDELKQQQVVEFQHSLRATGYALGTVNQVIILLRSFYNLAKKWEIPGAEKNPTAGIALYEANNARERFLTQEETQRLQEALELSENPQLKYIVPLLLLLGCRKRELLDSTWDQFDLERRSWRIPMSKSGKARHVPLSSAALSLLAQVPRWEGCPYVVPNPKTREPFVSVFYGWNTARKRAGLPEVRLHDMRHSMASNLVNSGRSILEVAKILGHSQLKTSQRYAHLSNDTLLAAVDAAATATGMNWSATP